MIMNGCWEQQAFSHVLALGKQDDLYDFFIQDFLPADCSEQRIYCYRSMKFLQIVLFGLFPL